jgi:predicted ATPase/class 3 adenylate cyclase
VSGDGQALTERAFLFTDLQGSTRAWEHSPSVMNEVLAEHDHLLRVAIESADGHVFSLAGDAFAAAFPSVTQAATAAIAGQRALAGTTWPEDLTPRVRMGIHRGEAFVRDDNYFGSTLNRAARIMSAAHGGQIVVSGPVADELGRDLPVGAQLRDLGTHRLKDLSEALAVWQLVVDDLPSEFPPLRSLDAATVHVPRSRTRFVGREAELEAVGRLLDEAAVVTLVAAGGTGKTRLGYEAALTAAGRFPDGVATVELADGGPDEVVPRLLEAVLGHDPLARVEGSADPMGAVVEHLTSRRSLLVIDNCEHVVPAVHAAVHQLTRSCPRLVVLATSREPLGVHGERVVRLAPLTPDGAVELFLDRARAASGRVRPEDRADVEDLCDQVEGLPLAIELAAARTRTLTPRQITDRLREDIGILRQRQGKADDRHRSLEAAIAWSYDLLDDDERALLEVLSIFVGGADLDAAEAVGGTVVDGDPLDLLESLVDRSLVASDLVGREARFRLPESVRQFARRRLAEHGDLAAAEQAHFDHYLAVARSVVPALDVDADPTVVDGLRAEHDNFLAAIDRELVERPGQSARLAMTLHTYWEETGHLAVGAEVLDKVLSAAPTDPAAMAGLGALIPYEAMCGQLPDARGRAEALTGLLGVGLPPLAESRIRFALGFVEQAGGSMAAAVELWDEAVTQALADDPAFARQVGFSVAYAALIADDLPRADQLLARARSIPPPVQGWFDQMAAVVGEVTAIVDGRDRVGALVGALTNVDAMGLRFRAVLADAAGAVGLFAAGEEAEATTWLRRGLALSRDMGHLWACWVLLEPAAWTVAERDPGLAAQAWGAIDRFAAERTYGSWPLIVRIGDGRRASVAAALGEDYEAALATGRGRPFNEVVDAVLAD